MGARGGGQRKDTRGVVAQTRKPKGRDRVRFVIREMRRSYCAFWILPEFDSHLRTVFFGFTVSLQLTHDTIRIPQPGPRTRRGHHTHRHRSCATSNQPHARRERLLNVYMPCPMDSHAFGPLFDPSHRSPAWRRQGSPRRRFSLLPPRAPTAHTCEEVHRRLDLLLGLRP